MVVDTSAVMAVLLDEPDAAAFAEAIAGGAGRLLSAVSALEAGLGFGDCAACALAATRAEPLLFKGADVAATDIEPYPLSRG